MFIINIIINIITSVIHMAYIIIILLWLLIRCNLFAFSLSFCVCLLLARATFITVFLSVKFARK
jgi:hypothetical protein